MKLENERETLCKHLTSAELSESSLSTQLTEAQEMLKTMKEERNAYQEERKAQEARHAQLEEEMKLLSCDLNKTKNSLIKKIGECVDLTAKYYEAEEYAGLFKKRIEDMQQSEVRFCIDPAEVPGCMYTVFLSIQTACVL
jgi:predicted nuclease with TOPRIM domain